MSTLADEDKASLLKYARAVIRAKLASNTSASTPESLSPELEKKCGCFVTLHKHGQLRGCIGTIEPVQPLISCIRENAINAAFRDPRFPSLKANELSDVDIEISTLTVPQKLTFNDVEDLKKKLKPGVHGVILSRGWQKATFLPQVWDQLPDVEEFLSQLCQKGGMGKNCWQDPETNIEVYEVEYFSE